MATKSTPKRWTQPQLSKLFASNAGMSIGQTSDLRYKIWMNPTDPQSLRLTLEGYRFAIQTLKLRAYEYELETPLTNKNLLQLERYFQGMYYLVNGKKIVFFDEAESMMLTLYDNNLRKYLQALEAANINP